MKGFDGGAEATSTTIQEKTTRAAGTCRELLGGEVSLFLFAFVDGVEPTNNAAESALRHGGAVAENESWSQERAGCRILGVYLVGGGDVPTAGPGCMGLPDGLHGRSRRRARHAVAVDAAK